ncbi:oxalurate catabolism protein HpxZ [Schauerella aestuarii]|uniref:oxalurate catabolism protein HpxZ n=1 Tax=Schauerella aestuarii TaxID=2511204 RepID=UPI001367F1E9|nr:oxalurate catabolism protein HpxZ [Achromobacter aestuarii]MYZ45681.1 oxalurate catabolism protein HpxZ [Achromobacter aestuarii]
MEINRPDVLATLTAAFERYERALVTNDVKVLDTLFWNSPHTVRYGAGENLHGFDAIAAFRASRPGAGLDRTITSQVLTTFGDSFGTASMTFTRAGSDAIGRQSQTWVKFAEGWRVTAAHVSTMKRGT